MILSKFIISIAVIISLLTMTGCAAKQQPIEPAVSQIRRICELAVLECYYHNVAKSVKPKKYIGQVERKFWIEYTGTAKIGIDLSQVKMTFDSEDPSIINVTIPKAKVLGIDVDESSLSEDSVILGADGFVKNKVSADDQTNAINEAQKKMEETAKNDTAVLVTAQERAKKLIENYILQLGNSCGVDYRVNWIELGDGEEIETTTSNTVANE